jgi:hypothetical protein
MTITSSKYLANSITGSNCSIRATINGTEMIVPLDPDNKEYAEILRQVEAGTLTIEDAD